MEEGQTFQGMLEQADLCVKDTNFNPNFTRYAKVKQQHFTGLIVKYKAIKLSRKHMRKSSREQAVLD